MQLVLHTQSSVFYLALCAAVIERITPSSSITPAQYICSQLTATCSPHTSQQCFIKSRTVSLSATSQLHYDSFRNGSVHHEFLKLRWLTNTEQTFWSCLCMLAWNGTEARWILACGKTTNLHDIGMTHIWPTSQSFIRTISRDEHSAVRFSLFFC